VQYKCMYHAVFNPCEYCMMAKRRGYCCTRRMLAAGHCNMMMHMAGGTLACQSGVPFPVGTPHVANVTPINMPRGPVPTGGKLEIVSTVWQGCWWAPLLHCCEDERNFVASFSKALIRRRELCSTSSCHLTLLAPGHCRGSPDSSLLHSSRQHSSARNIECAIEND
jgi:hypothetical protein